MSNEKLLAILKMPIDVTCGSKKKVIIDFSAGRISSTQSYRGSDPDMSDIAIDFYATIYDIKELLRKKSLVNTDFCGDTMTSFKTIKRNLNVESMTDAEICDVTHCLVNFWLLPMDVGHSSPRTAKRKLMYLSKSAKCRDEMGWFLNFYSYNYEEYDRQYKKYTESFPREEFRYKHYLCGINYEAWSSIEDVFQAQDIRANNIVQRKDNKVKEMIRENAYIIKGE